MLRNIVQNILIFFAAINMVLSPVALAAPLSEADQAKIAQYKNFLEPMGYELRLDVSGEKALVFDKASQKLAMEIPFAAEGELKKYSPKNLNQMMLEEMSRIKASNKAAWSHSVRNLPAESAIFFVAMGAVVASQLITNYSQNPVALQQHVEHSLSPLGVFGFFTFMYSQGVTANVLAMYMKNPKFHHMIPYLGMTVGAFLQTYLSQVASDPNVKACAKTMMGTALTQKDYESGVEKDPCAKAYEYLVLKKKIWEFAPGIVSMLISSGLAGAAQSLATKAIIRVTGVDIALWLAPGSMHLKGIRLLLVKGLQITAFVAIDAWLNRHVTYVWKNMYDGAEFYEVNDQLNAEINDLKSKSWSTSSVSLQKQLKEFREKMVNWRMMNMSEVYEAHQNWSQALLQMTSMFNASYHFYDSFLVEARNSRYQESPIRLLERSYPYYGVKAHDLNEGREDLYFLKPDFVEPLQEDTISQAIAWAESYLQSKDGKYLYKNEREKAQSIINSLKANSRIEKGNALVSFNVDFQAGLVNAGTSHPYKRFLSDFKNKLGNPSPKMGIGHGFGATYTSSPLQADILKNANYYRQVGAFFTPQISDYFLMQMVCGPDLEKGGTVIRNSTGFPSVFMPPQIKKSQDAFRHCTNFGTPQLRAENIYAVPVASSGKTYKGYADYLIHEARLSAIGSQENDEAFSQWWKQKTEGQILKAFEEYGKHYDEIVTKLVAKIFNEEKSIVNGRPILQNPLKSIKFYFSSEERKRYVEGGPIHNGALKSALQEERYYLSILEDLAKPQKQFNSEFIRTLENSPTNELSLSVEAEFIKLRDLLKRIQVVQKQGRSVIASDLENYQIDEQVGNIQAALKKIADHLGVGDEPSLAQVKLNKNQHEVAVLVLENLQSLASEIMMYGVIANAVNWDKIQDTKRINMEQQKFNNEIQAKLAIIRGVTLPGAK